MAQRDHFRAGEWSANIFAPIGSPAEPPRIWLGYRESQPPGADAMHLTSLDEADLQDLDYIVSRLLDEIARLKADSPD